MTRPTAPQKPTPQPDTFVSPVEALSKIGSALRAINETETRFAVRIAEFEKEIAALRKQMHDESLPHIEEAVHYANALYAYAQEHRDKLTARSPTVRFMTNDCIRWTQAPPSVHIADEDALLALLKTRRLKYFIRTKYEINRQAMLASEARQREAKLLPGVTIATQEKFSIIPDKISLRLETTVTPSGPHWEIAPKKS